MKKIKIAILCFGILISSLFATAYAYLKNSLPDDEGIVKSADIQKSVSIKKDSWGVPYLNSSTLEDFFFAVGYAHASDRMFQMDLMRRTVLGRLSEIFGPKTLDSDKLHRNLLLPERCETLAASIQSDVKHFLVKYCSGVNEYIQNGPLAVEFRLLNYRPEPWALKDIAAVYYEMVLTLAGSCHELQNWRLAHALGQAYYDDFIATAHQGTSITVDENWTMYRNPTLAALLTTETDLTNNSIGSNSWVVSGKKSLTGKPLLANDPHLAVLLPSYFYQVYADIPHGILSGNTIPGIPYIIIGRNQNIGWGFTNNATDVIDYYQLNVNPDNPEQYELDGRWEDFTYSENKIKVKSGQDVMYPVKVSRFGPIMAEQDTLFARHCMLQYKSSVFESLHAMNFAEDIDGFIQGLKLFTAPAQHVIFADIRGNIGYYPTGAVPKRNCGDGVFPVVATRTSDLWQGFYPEEEKPYLVNPKAGYIVTANNPVIDDVSIPIYPRDKPPAFRAMRITDLIQQKEKHTVASLKRIQCDTFLPSAVFLIKICEKLPIQSKSGLSVLDRLKRWPMRAEAGVEPLLFYNFEHNLAENIFSDHLVHRENIPDFVPQLYKVLSSPDFEHKYAAWIDDATTSEIEDFKDMVERSLLEVHQNVLTPGNKPGQRWDRLHTLTYRHPLGSLKMLAPWVNRGPYTVFGGKGCILTAGFKGVGEYRVNQISAFRMILDFSEFSNSMIINASGQSGHFMSRHYDDQVPLFIRSGYRPMETMEDIYSELTILPESTPMSKKSYRCTPDTLATLGR